MLCSFVVAVSRNAAEQHWGHFLTRTLLVCFDKGRFHCLHLHLEIQQESTVYQCVNQRKVKSKSPVGTMNFE